MVTDLFISFRVVVITLARVIGLSESQALEFTNLLFKQDIGTIDVDLILQLLDDVTVEEEK